LILRPF
jgi:YD repeat-containing protein